MSLIVSAKTYVEGDVPTASELNAPFDDLQSASSNIDGENAASGWITWRHLEAGLAGVSIANSLY